MGSKRRNKRQSDGIQTRGEPSYCVEDAEAETSTATEGEASALQPFECPDDKSPCPIETAGVWSLKDPRTTARLGFLQRKQR